MFAAGGSASYGELESTDQLLRLLDLGPEHTFVDLGSGRGRVALHAALKTRAGRSVGLEMSQVRHRHALEAAARMQARGAHLRGEGVRGGGARGGGARVTLRTLRSGRALTGNVWFIHFFGRGGLRGVQSPS